VPCNLGKAHHTPFLQNASHLKYKKEVAIKEVKKIRDAQLRIIRTIPSHINAQKYLPFMN
jgi:hypothetical protein